MYESNWYFWFGSADYMVNDGASMENDHIDAALFTKLKRFWGFTLRLFSFFPIFNDKEIKTHQLACYTVYIQHITTIAFHIGYIQNVRSTS